MVELSRRLEGADSFRSKWSLRRDESAHWHYASVHFHPAAKKISVSRISQSRPIVQSRPCSLFTHPKGVGKKRRFTRMAETRALCDCLCEFARVNLSV
jgi:hypothetical protein